MRPFPGNPSRSRRLRLAGLFFLLLAGPLFGETILFRDNFEGYAHGQVPDSPLGAGAGWDSPVGPGGTIIETTTDTGFAQSAPNSLKIDKSSNAGTESYIESYFQVASQNYVSIQYSLLVEDGIPTVHSTGIIQYRDGANIGPMIILWPSSNTNSINGFTVGGGYNGSDLNQKISFANGTGIEPTSITYNLGTRYDIQILANTTAKTYRVWINGSLVTPSGSDPSFYDGSVSSITRVRFSSFATAPTLYIDDIRVTEDPSSFYITGRETADRDKNGKIDAIKITTNAPLLDSSFDESQFTVNGRTITGSDTGTTTDDNTMFLLLSESSFLDTHVTPEVRFVGGGSAIEDRDQTGQLQAESNGQAAGDGAGPVILTGSVRLVDSDSGGSINTGDKIQIGFSENISLSAGSAPGDSFSFSAGSPGTALPDLTKDGDNIIGLTLGTGPTMTPDTTTINILATNLNIRDSSGNPAIPLSTAATVAGFDDTPPQLLALTYFDSDGNGKVDRAVLRFSESIADTSLSGGAGSFLLNGFANLAPDASQGVEGFDPGNANDEYLTLDFSEIDSAAENTRLESLSFTQSGSLFTDLSGNPLASFSGTSGLPLTDRAPPRLLSATAGRVEQSSEITLVFSEPVEQPANFAEQINEALVLNNDHSWFVATNYPDISADSPAREITITLNAAQGQPDIAIGDTITPAASFWQDPAGNALTETTISLTGTLVDYITVASFEVTASETKIDLSLKETFRLEVQALNELGEAVNTEGEIRLEARDENDQPLSAGRLTGTRDSYTLTGGSITISGLSFSRMATIRLVVLDTENAEIRSPIKESPRIKFGRYYDKNRVRQNVFSPRSGEKTWVDYRAQTSGELRIRILDIRGRTVARLLKKRVRAGSKGSVTWSGRDLGGNTVGRGLYFVHIQNGSHREILKILVR